MQGSFGDARILWRSFGDARILQKEDTLEMQGSSIAVRILAVGLPPS
jgi:hypothetical protein